MHFSIFLGTVKLKLYVYTENYCPWLDLLCWYMHSYMMRATVYSNRSLSTVLTIPHEKFCKSTVLFSRTKKKKCTWYCNALYIKKITTFLLSLCYIENLIQSRGFYHFVYVSVIITLYEIRDVNEMQLA